MDTNYGWDIDPKDSGEYINSCKKIIEDSNIFDNFKSSKEYNVILEHVHYELGLQYYDHIQKVGKEIYEKYLNKFLENDQIGNPNQFFYGNGKISPTTLRYIKNCLDLSFLCDGQGVSKIVEVGGGYGGLCKTLSVLCNFDEYLNIDLPETVLLQEKYLKNFSEIYSKIKYVPCNELEDISNIDLFISNYSFSELTIETQLNYYNKIIKNSKIIYITYNLIVNDSIDNYNIIVSKLKEDGFKLEDNYFDYGSHNNIIIAGKR
jgi:putative sugar O-methyltransferase